MGAALVAAAVVAVVVSIVSGSRQAWAHYGLQFLWSGTFNPTDGQYAAGVLVVGTVVTTGVAMVLAVPLGLGAAIALAEVLPARVAGLVASAVDLLAGVPSIVVGLWALIVLEPLFQRDIEPALHHIPGLGTWVFNGPAYGPSIILASTVLAIMVLPTLVSLSRSALLGVARADREAARALGATRWQATRRVLLPTARSGIGAAITLAIGRALGESIAVAMVIGNTPDLPHSLTGPGETLGSAIVNQFAEATPGLGTASVIALGAVLLLLTVAVNACGKALWANGRQSRRLRSCTAPTPVSTGPALAGGPVLAASGPARPYVPNARGDAPSGRSDQALGRRLWAGRGLEALCGLCLLVVAAPLVAMLGYTLFKGAGGLSWSFFFKPPAPLGLAGGGISTALAGTVKIMLLALVMAVPASLLGALFLFENKTRLAGALRTGTEVLSGVPSIVIGIFAYSAIVIPLHHPSMVAASVGVAVLMLPIMTRANEEAIRAVPSDLHEAGAALGARRSRVVRSIVLRTSLPGLVAGNLLAVARATGETAPLLFTLAAPTMAMTVLIFNDATQPYPSSQATAWATALVLLAGILVLSLVARGVAAHLTRKAR